MKFVWKTYILPIADYCSQLWSPCSRGMLTKLENLQKDFTSMINGMKSLNYWQRLEKLKMLSLNRRFER